MAYQLDIPNFSGSDIAIIYQFPDAQLNSGVLYVFLHGVYFHVGSGCAHLHHYL